MSDADTDHEFDRQSGYFERDGDLAIPRSIARAAWGDSVGGHNLGGLLAWAIERDVDDHQLQPARLTVDLPKPTRLQPIAVHTRLLREGKRLRLAEALLIQDSEPVARATALFLRRCQQPDGQVWSPELPMPPVPDDLSTSDPSFFVRTYGWGVPVQRPDPGWVDVVGAKYTWLHLTRPVFDGEPLTAFACAAMAADVTASLANWGSKGLQFINADYTLTLSRLPEGRVLGLASQTQFSHEGVATGSAVLVDPSGPIGNTVSVSLAHSGFRPPTR